MSFQCSWHVYMPSRNLKDEKHYDKAVTCSSWVYASKDEIRLNCEACQTSCMEMLTSNASEGEEEIQESWVGLLLLLGPICLEELLWESWKSQNIWNE